MTGRGGAAASCRLAHVEVELSSVNRKQLDMDISLPRSLALFESRIQEQVRARIARGRISGEVRVTWSAAAQAAGVRVDQGLARASVAALRAAAKTLGLPDDLQASALLAVPGVIVQERRAQDIEALWPALRRALAEALTQLLAMRRKEGAALQRDLRRRLATLRRLARQIAARAPAVAAAYRESLRQRIAAAVPGSDLAADDRLLKEVALFADRADITEELVRLQSHFAQTAEALQQGGVVGRTLDFLVVEMGREINTIGAKANDAPIARLVVAGKTELERVREQVQNIE
ncbi:MAG: YicC family protein [Kiritimatiellae bacterium]|nr:YicC family protein [Kiritimatiellia bacterium]MBP9572600.1 YicC family protein [Kiritimatiellia bacterium]